jgi:hypothetical protein
VPTLRNNYRADLVSMFVENPSYCGMAWFGPLESHAFSVVARNCATGYFSFAHEVGHNLGLDHDLANAVSSPYEYGHGYIDPGCQFRTVMAYASCNAPRVGYHSNPNIVYPGTNSVLGDATFADSVRVVQQTAVTVAKFRSEVDASRCIEATPTINVSPVTQTGSAGQSLSYQVTVANNDSTECTTSNFVVNPILPADFVQTPTSLALNIIPGGQSSQTVVITPSVAMSAGTYTFTETVQKGGEGSPFTSSKSANYVVFEPDRTAPVITSMKPVDGSVITATTDISATATDPSGISKIEIRVDNKLVKSCKTASCNYRWSIAKTTAGTHTIAVTVADKSPNLNKTTQTVTVSVVK